MKIERNYKTVGFFLILITIGAGLSIFFILPVLQSKPLSIIYMFIHIILLGSFLGAGLIQPGYVEKSKNYDFQTLLDNLDPIYLCPECEVIRTPRSRHCNMGNRCIDRYDHHGPYINNGVGYRNHIYFVTFLISVGVLIAYQIIITALAYKNDPELNSWSFMKYKHGGLVFNIIAIFTFVIGSIFFIPVFILTFTHIGNFLWGQTTHERFADTKNEDVLLGSSHATNSQKSSLTKSIFESEILVQDNTSPQSFNYISNQKLSASYVGVKKKKGRGANIGKMVGYKQPSQEKTRQIVLKLMKQSN